MEETSTHGRTGQWHRKRTSQEEVDTRKKKGTFAKEKESYTGKEGVFVEAGMVVETEKALTRSEEKVIERKVP